MASAAGQISPKSIVYIYPIPYILSNFPILPILYIPVFRRPPPQDGDIRKLFILIFLYFIFIIFFLNFIFLFSAASTAGQRIPESIFYIYSISYILSIFSIYPILYIHVFRRLPPQDGVSCPVAGGQGAGALEMLL